MQQDHCWMLHSQPNATKSPVAHCCTWHATDDHLVKLTLHSILHIARSICGSCSFWQGTHSDKCCILLHSAWYPLIDNERLGLMNVCTCTCTVYDWKCLIQHTHNSLQTLTLQMLYLPFKQTWDSKSILYKPLSYFWIAQSLLQNLTLALFAINNPCKPNLALHGYQQHMTYVTANLTLHCWWSIIAFYKVTSSTSAKLASILYLAFVKFRDSTKSILEGKLWQFITRSPITCKPHTKPYAVCYLFLYVHVVLQRFIEPFPVNCEQIN